MIQNFFSCNFITWQSHVSFIILSIEPWFMWRSTILRLQGAQKRLIHFYQMEKKLTKMKKVLQQAEKLKSREMKEGWMNNDEGWWRMKDKWWRMNDEGWWFQAVEGFWWWTNRRTGICDCRVAFTTEKRHLYLIALINYVL